MDKMIPIKVDRSLLDTGAFFYGGKYCIVGYLLHSAGVPDDVLNRNTDLFEIGIDGCKLPDFITAPCEDASGQSIDDVWNPVISMNDNPHWKPADKEQRIKDMLHNRGVEVEFIGSYAGIEHPWGYIEDEEI